MNPLAKALQIANRLELLDPSVSEHVVALIRGGRGADLDREIEALQEIALLLEPDSALHAATERLLAAFRSGDAELIEQAWPAWITLIAAPAAYSLLPATQADLTATTTKIAATARKKSAGMVCYQKEKAAAHKERDAQIYAEYEKLKASNSPGASDRAYSALASTHKLSKQRVKGIVTAQRKQAGNS